MKFSQSIKMIHTFKVHHLIINNRNSRKAVITDSGGITEETTVMRVPCITLRNNTERPETVEIGTNELIGTDPQNLPPAFKKIFSGEWKKGDIPPLWDGKTGVRIIDVLNNLYN